MAIKVARGQITIIDQNDAVSLQAFIGSNQPLTQVYNKDTNTYAPSWTASPYLVLTPALYVSGKGGTDQITAVGNAAALTPGIKSGSTKWYKNGTLITNGQDSCTIGAASAKYALTIKANHLTIAAPQARYTFEAIYLDANGLEISFRAEVQFTQHLNAGAMIAAVCYAPDGIVFKNDEISTLRAHCDLWRGAAIDTTNVTYAWGIKDSSVFAPTTLSAAAAAGATTITVAAVTNMEAGGKITVGAAQYTISSVNTSTKVVTLTSALSAAAASGDAVSCPYYNAMLGVGWSYLTSTNQRGVTAGWTTNEITITAEPYSISKPSSAPLKIPTPRPATPRPTKSSATFSPSRTCPIPSRSIWSARKGSSSRTTATMWTSRPSSIATVRRSIRREQPIPTRGNSGMPQVHRW